MTFSSLEQLVGGLERRPQWRSHHQFQEILEHWPTIVGEVVAAQAFPLSIHRRVLNVSVSTPAWAQNLAFQRHHILTKLAQVLPEQDLKDIRFSPATWTRLKTATTQTKPFKNEQKQTLKQYHLDQSEARALWSYHPSQVSGTATDDLGSDTDFPAPDTPVEVFHDWAAKIQMRSQQLPKCPCCKAPTPIGELKRWSMCGLCVAKKWQHQPPNTST